MCAKAQLLRTGAEGGGLVVAGLPFQNRKELERSVLSISKMGEEGAGAGNIKVEP